ncbi:hypothetical protein [Vibrio ulleungensis]|uniref:HEAT repeat domain-containing protein n=1 Tax=Vibrio ulleungensis TaxID=2807619 RepID=A0ABS2HG95_9VIBR|nr:hypothetical protein [Vibrio ulleungensis]MBM7036565.1 hypothetical protein [Vibrio ulleungensis]
MIEALKRLKLVIRCRVGNPLVVFVTLLSFNASSSEGLCDVIRYESQQKIEQGKISEFLNGVQRRTYEVASVTRVLNTIYSNDLLVEDYKNIEQCMDTLDNRYVDRNKNVFLLASVGRIELESINESKESLKLYTFDFLKSNDVIEVMEAINAIAVIKDKDSIDQLLTFVAQHENITLVEFALSSLHTIGGDYIYARLKSISEADSSLTKLIEGYLFMW